LPDYRGCLQAPLAEQDSPGQGHAGPCLQAAPLPLALHSQRTPQEQEALAYTPATGWPSWVKHSTTPPAPFRSPGSHLDPSCGEVTPAKTSAKGGTVPSLQHSTSSA